MIPIRDLNESGSRPYVCWSLIALNIAVFAFQLSLGSEGTEYLVHHAGLSLRRLSLAALGQADLLLVPAPLTLVTHMFVHGGFLHIIGNMWFLFIFGDNVEDALGHGRFVLFYLACGLAAALGEILLGGHPEVPMVGASGAIAGVMGAYVWLFPTARIVTLVPIFVFFTFIQIPAIFYLGIWLAMQIFNGSGSLAAGGQDGGGTAWWAHIGGFVAGVGLLWTLFRPRGRFWRRQSLAGRHSLWQPFPRKPSTPPRWRS